MNIKQGRWVAGALVLLVAGAVNASVITNYYDGFGGLQTEALNGTAPDVRPGSEVWDARELDPLDARDLRADGSFAAGGPGAVAGSLPLNIESGKIYTFSVDLMIANPTNGAAGEPTHWAGLSITTNSQTGNITSGGIVTLLLRRNGGAQGIVPGGTPTPINVAEGTYSTTQQLAIVVNTALSPWSASLRIGGAPIGTSALAPAACVPGTNYISIGQLGTAAGAFDDLLVAVEDVEETGSGNTIYQDDFSGNAGTDLNGLAPDIRPGSETWAAETRFKADGSFSLSSAATAVNASAYLPFTPVAGKVYTLSVDVAQPSGDADTRWAGLAFGNSSMLTSSGPISGWRSAATLVYRQSGAAQAYYGGDGTSSGANSVGILAGSSGTQTLKMVLDTTAADWKVDYFIGANAVGSHTFDGYPGDGTGTPTADTRPIANVGISINGANDFTTTFDNFTLTEGTTGPAGPSTIVSSSVTSGGLLKLVIDAPDALTDYRLVERESLSFGAWTYAAHSDDGSNPFVATNLSYSTAEGGDVAVYVQTTNAASFFGIE